MDKNLKIGVKVNVVKFAITLPFLLFVVKYNKRKIALFIARVIHVDLDVNAIQSTDKT
jgi:hypothetical protein